MRELLAGVAQLGRGFGYWRRMPGRMALGLVPAAIVAAVLLGGLVALGIALPGLTEAITPFADGWPGLWASVIRIAIGTALVGAALVLVAVTFTALTLVVGDPFYESIWRAVERDLGGPQPEARYGFWRSAADALALFARGVGVALVAALAGLVPLVGGVLGAVVGVTLTGLLLADELTSRALSARGMDAAARRAARRRRRARTLGFGIATQLCFLVPLGAVLTMPAAVAGATLLARSMLDPSDLAGRAAPAASAEPASSIDPAGPAAL